MCSTSSNTVHIDIDIEGEVAMNTHYLNPDSAFERLIILHISITEDGEVVLHLASLSRVCRRVVKCRVARDAAGILVVVPLQRRPHPRHRVSPYQ